MAQLRCDLPGQFILLQDSKHIPAQWNIKQNGDWLLATHSSLPVIDIFTSDFVQLGWFIGYPISLDTQLLTEKTVFPIHFNHNGLQQCIETYLSEFGGRFLAIFPNTKISRVYLDPCGSLSAVYSLDQPIVASTSALIPMNEGDSDYDNELVTKLGMPESDKWYPSGLTPRKTLKRLLPNHFLELSNFKVIRHWPGNTEFRVNPETKGPIKEIVKLVKNNIYAVDKNFPIYIPLTAGRDSRMLLACAKEITSRIDFFTIRGKKAEEDCYISSKICRRFNLNHHLLQIETATQAQLEDWLYRSGYCVSGQTWKNHQTAVRHLDINRAVLLGLASPVGKASYWRQTDTESTQLTPEEILRRLRLPADGEIIKMTRDWFAEISHLNAFLILDLTYIEQRLGCWGGPQLYGQRRTTAPYLLPFCHRKIFELMLKLPYEYRRRQELTIDILRQEWPELLDLPFNSFTGMRAYIDSISKALSRIKKKVYSIKK